MFRHRNIWLFTHVRGAVRRVLLSRPLSHVLIVEDEECFEWKIRDDELWEAIRSHQHHRTAQPNNIESGSAHMARKKRSSSSKPHCRQSVMCLSFACCSLVTCQDVALHAINIFYFSSFSGAPLVILKCKLPSTAFNLPRQQQNRRGKL